MDVPKLKRLMTTVAHLYETTRETLRYGCASMLHPNAVVLCPAAMGSSVCLPFWPE
jgi:hypothetical protein